jgi:hypothetical protein
MNSPPHPPRLSGIAIKMLAFYIEWHQIFSRHILKDLRYSLGVRIDALFAQVLEGISLAQFSPPASKSTYLSNTIGKNDTLKFMLYALHELRGIDEKKFLSLSAKAEEIGRMLYGWKVSTEKRTAERTAVAADARRRP